MDDKTKIKIACIYAGISQAELGRRLGKSRQGFNAKVNSGNFTASEMEEIAKALGADYVHFIRFPNGQVF